MFTFLEAVSSTRVGPVMGYLTKLFKMFEVPRRIMAVRGSCFTSKRFSEFYKEHNIKLVLNATATPRANGQVKRLNQTILSQLTSSIEEEYKWDKLVGRAHWGINSTPNSTTGKTPYKLFFGYTPRNTNDAILTNVVGEDTHDNKLNTTRADVVKRIDKEQ